MSGAVKIFGIIITSTIILFSLLLFNKKIFIENDIFQSVRDTQLSVMDEGILLGELFVNNKVMIDKDECVKRWVELFNINKDFKEEYHIRIIDINSFPAAIAVVVSKDEELFDEKNIDLEFTNVIIADYGR
ncbi:MAG: DUF5411 family protein [Anaerorhabdus sp.]